MIRISIPFLFMIYDSSSIPISDFCICSYFRIFHIFTNLLYTKNLTNLTNLTILQILQPYKPYNLTGNVSTHFYFVQLAQVEVHFSVWPAQDSNWKNDISQLRNGLFHSVRGQSEMMAWNRVNRQKIKRTHRSRSFWSPRRCSQSIKRFTSHSAHSPLCTSSWWIASRRWCIAAATDSTALSYSRIVWIDWPARAPSLLRSRSAR